MMNILHVTCSLISISGGPAEAIKQLTSAVSDLGHHVEIVTLDKTDKYFINNKGIKIHALGPSLGKYHLNIKLVPWLIKYANRYDVIIVHGIWQYSGFAVWLASRFIKFPYFVFVHGALAPWFKTTYPLKHLKKWLYWPWAGYNIIRSAKAVLFTSEEEKRLASKSFRLYKANEVVVPYGIRSPNGDPNIQTRMFYEAFPGLAGRKYFLFMGRIHPIKGVDYLIEAFSKIANKNTKVHLVIAGPDGSNLLLTLKKLARKFLIEDNITWTGMLNDELKWGALHSTDCLILPSHSENFGVVVTEALACGVPVIITDKVNIWREIENSKAGFICSDDVSSLSSAIQKWLDLDDDEKKRMGANAKSCFARYFEINSSAKKYIEIIQNELTK
jgi:glycosyltransferase involved in cell wall biosynthesis